MSHRLRPMAVVILGGTLALWAPAAARDLIVIDGPLKAEEVDCKGCVKRKNLGKKAVDADKIQNKAVISGKIAAGAVGTGQIEDTAVTAGKLTPEALEMLSGSQSAFYITLDSDGAEETIATNGPLTYFARCLLNQPGDGNFDVIQIVATSSVDGWFEAEENQSSFYYGSPVTLGTSGGTMPFLAGEEVVVDSRSVLPTGSARYGRLEETSIVAPDGSYLALEGDTGGMGLNIFEHRCLVVGTSYSITEVPGTQ